MPFMDEPPGGKLSSAAVGMYGHMISARFGASQTQRSIKNPSGGIAIRS
jgi:hypothetical protein